MSHCSIYKIKTLGEVLRFWIKENSIIKHTLIYLKYGYFIPFTVMV